MPFKPQLRWLRTRNPDSPHVGINLMVSYRKCQQRLYYYCLRNLRSFNVDNTILSMFHKSCIQSVLTFSFICWFGNVSQKDKNNLQRIVNISSKVTEQVVNKATRILADDTHVLHADYILLPSVYIPCDIFATTIIRIRIPCVGRNSDVLFLCTFFFFYHDCIFINFYSNAVHKFPVYGTIKLYCIALHCIALHCIALHCIALHCIALHCIALHCIALHCIALHCIALHCIALHCIALHCIVLYCKSQPIIPRCGRHAYAIIGAGL